MNSRAVIRALELLVHPVVTPNGRHRLYLSLIRKKALLSKAVFNLFFSCSEGLEVALTRKAGGHVAKLPIPLLSYFQRVMFLHVVSGPI